MSNTSYCLYMGTANKVPVNKDQQMNTYTVTVSDARGKYPTQVFSVTADKAFLAESSAIELFIKANGHPPYKFGKSASAYYSRFWASAV